MGLIDPTTVTRCFDAYARVLTLYARQWMGTEEAEDVVQDVFCQLVSQREQPRDIKAWLFRAVRNAALNRLRSRNRRRRRETQRTRDEPAYFEARPEDLIDARVVCEQLEHLPTKAREMVVLRIWGDLTFAQIAAITGVSPATALRHYRSALQQIRQRLEQACQSKRPV